MPRVAASGEWGGGLGAVVPAVGELGPQHLAVVVAVVVDVVVVAVVLLLLLLFVASVAAVAVAVAVAAAAAVIIVRCLSDLVNSLSPTTSISSSSSMVERRDFRLGNGDSCSSLEAVAVGVLLALSSILRSSQGYAFHFLAIRQRGILS